MELDADTDAPARARAYVREQLDHTAVATNAREDLLVITSELVTNSVRSGADHVHVDLEIEPQTLTLSVADDGAGWPTLVADMDASTTGGRGLAMVELLADHWGVVPWDGGKRVITVQHLSAPSHR